MKEKESEKRREEIKWETIKDVSSNTLGTLLPFIILLVLMPAFNGSDVFYKIILRGDFFIYSAALWTTVLYLHFEHPNSGTKALSIWSSLAWLFIALSACFFATLNVLEYSNLNGRYIGWTSIIFFMLSLYPLYKNLEIKNREKTPIKTNSKRESEVEIKNMLGGLK